MPPDRIVLLSTRFPPHLRLFTIRGEQVWSGGRRGGGPDEFDQPQSIAVRDSTVLVFQRGRVSHWVHTGDTLGFQAVMQLPAEYSPLGAVPACEQDEWLLYARNGRQLPGAGPRTADEPQRIDHIYTLRFSLELGPVLTPWWGTELDPGTTPYTGHSAVLIERTDTLIAVLHRNNAWSGGEVLLFNCEGDLLSSYSEHALAVGDPIPAKLPRHRDLQWTAGIVALPNGMAVALQRWFTPGFHDVTEPIWKTEIFSFLDGRFTGSRVIDRQWFLMGYQSGYGILMSSDEPVPHFVWVPPDLLLPNEDEAMQ